MNTPEQGLNRRAFLTMSWWQKEAAAPAGTEPEAPASNLILLGSIEDLQALDTGAVLVSPARADIHIVRTPAGALALRARCPNDGAPVSWRDKEPSEDTLAPTGRFYCSRDASIFSRLGDLAAGPADNPLPALPIVEHDGSLWADEAKPDESEPQERLERVFPLAAAQEP